MNQKLDTFFRSARQWRDEMSALRAIVLDCGLTEELKWRQPVYTFRKKNVVIISGFKDYCLLGFFKGSLLTDTHGLLMQPGEHAQAMRQLRFTSVKEIVKRKSIIKAAIREAVEVEKADLKVKFKKTEEYNIPEELQRTFDDSPAFKEAFNTLTPGRQRAYILYFSAAKQSKTRSARIEKYMRHILSGKGVDDR